MNYSRVIKQNKATEGEGPVIYWMQRDQRVNDNWALIYAAKKAAEKGSQLVVVFNLVPKFEEATIRQYGFMLRGLKEVEQNLHKLNIPFRMLFGVPQETIPKFVEDINASAVISDFNPLRVIRQWKRELIARINVPYCTVDAHNIIPAWVVSNKEEFAAYTFRPKFNKLLDDYLDEFPPLPVFESGAVGLQEFNLQQAFDSLTVNRNVKEVEWLKPGEEGAMETLQHFFKEIYPTYAELRNDPTAGMVSNLSPYLHFGQISAQKITLLTKELNKRDENEKVFLEELNVRRELADNFCFYNADYDNYNGIKDWAKTTLEDHRDDKREHVYSLEQFEEAATDEGLWNAAQNELRRTGKLHGYMRMYWAKKILEWSKSPEEAFNIAIYLNDKYELDGRDPNGYTGVAWSVGGIHDRAWKEREVYGKIRYMNYNGCARKFDVKKYISQNISYK